MTTLEKIARALDSHPFLELDLALSRNSGTPNALYISRLRMHTETPLANARKAVEVLRVHFEALNEFWGFSFAEELQTILNEKD